MPNCSYFLQPYISKDKFIIGSIVVLIVLSGILLSLARNRLDNIIVGVIVGGAFINIIERYLFTCINDYFNFFDLFHFNLADVAITVGVLTLVYRLVINKMMPGR